MNNFTIDGVHLDATHMVLLKDNNKIRETNSGLWPALWASAGNIQEQDVVAMPYDGSEVVICFNMWWWSIGHWIMQTLPAIDWSIRNNRDRKVKLALPSNLNQFHIDSLELLNIDWDSVIYIDQAHPYYFPSAQYNEFLEPWFMKGLSLEANKFFERLAGAVPEEAANNKIIYVARTDTPNRKIVNEETLISILRDRGAHIVETSKLSFRERVNTFRNARFVIGPHGTGLTHVIFCKSSSWVYELMPETYADQVTNVLTKARGINFFTSSYPAIGNLDLQSTTAAETPSESLYRAEYSLDIDEVVENFDQVRRWVEL